IGSSRYLDQLRMRDSFFANVPVADFKTIPGFAHALLAAGIPVVADPIGSYPGMATRTLGVVWQWYLAGHEPEACTQVGPLLGLCARWPEAVSRMPVARNE